MHVIKEGLKSAILLVRLIFPILFVLEILQYFQLITPLALFLSPVIQLLELPSEFSVVWIIGLLTGVYGAIASFFYIVSSPENYSVAQVSILSALILIAHALPIEAKISQRLGLNYWKVIAFRMVLSIVFALLIKCVLDYFSLLENTIHLTPFKAIELQNMGVITIFMNPIIICVEMSVVIIVLHLVIHALKQIRVVECIEFLLKPLCYSLKIDHRLSNSLLVGIVLGVSYGGSLLIQDINNAQAVDKNEKKKVVYLLNILHSLVEDTMLVLLIGADIFVVLFGRILFTLVVMFLIDIRYKKYSFQEKYM